MGNASQNIDEERRIRPEIFDDTLPCLSLLFCIYKIDLQN